MSETVLVTGRHGFVASHLQVLLGDRAARAEVDVTDADETAQLVAGLAPDATGSTSSSRARCDVCRAYGLLLEPDVPSGVYNVASGTAVGMRNVVDLLVSMLAVPFTWKWTKLVFARPIRIMSGDKIAAV